MPDCGLSDSFVASRHRDVDDGRATIGRRLRLAIRNIAPIYPRSSTSHWDSCQRVVLSLYFVDEFDIFWRGSYDPEVRVCN